MATTPRLTAIQRALQIVGSQPALAKHCGVTQSAVSQWQNGVTAIHHKHWPRICEATGGKVSIEELAADEIAKVGNFPSRAAPSRPQVA